MIFNIKNQSERVHIYFRNEKKNILNTNNGS